MPAAGHCSRMKADDEHGANKLPTSCLGSRGVRDRRNPAGFVAARQVARLMPASAQLTLCAVVNPAAVERSGSSEQRLTRQAEEALERTHLEIAAFHDADVILREGPPIRRLLD
jgi:hypothetical protein